MQVELVERSTLILGVAGILVDQVRLNILEREVDVPDDLASTRE